MDDQQKTDLENAPPPEEQELKNEELDELSGGTNAGGTSGGPLRPTH
jgi:hypothetical protein